MKKNRLPATLQDLEDLSPRWERQAPEHLYDAKIFTLEKVPSLSPETGKKFDFFRLTAEPWINVVALTPDNTMIYVVQQRHGIDRATLEIPAGLVDPGEEPEKAAWRELEEETGYVPEEMIHLGTVYPNPAFLNNMCYTYLAKNCALKGTIDRDASEELKVVHLPAGEFRELLCSGMLGNSMGIVALFWYDLYLRGLRWHGDENMGLGPVQVLPAQ